MPIQPGTYELGPADGTLSVRTSRTGAAAKAGHDLRMEVGSWSATIALAEDPAQTTMRLSADSRSLRVLEGTGGMSALDEDDRLSPILAHLSRSFTAPETTFDASSQPSSLQPTRY